ncbi:hypothetical protein [Paraburkholderia sp. 32]|uniref:hypothetical protein n=1 Tax=Paraburkholderia sp. 32 TaxID=2991057 RepID=UPI003D250C98
MTYKQVEHMTNAELIAVIEQGRAAWHAEADQAKNDELFDRVGFAMTEYRGRLRAGRLTQTA